MKQAGLELVNDPPGTLSSECNHCRYDSDGPRTLIFLQLKKLGRKTTDRLAFLSQSRHSRAESAWQKDRAGDA